MSVGASSELPPPKNKKTAGLSTSGIFLKKSAELLDVARNELGHFEHRHLGLATENSFESSVGVDVAFIFFILKLVLLDVVPEFFGELTTGRRSGSHDSGEDGVGLNGFEKCGVGFALGLGFCRHVIFYLLGWVCQLPIFFSKAGKLVRELFGREQRCR